MIFGEIITPPFTGKRIVLHKFTMSPGDEATRGYTFDRFQFPIRLSFAMTINKSQGATLDKVSLPIPRSVNSLGGHRAACSRLLAWPALRGPLASEDFQPRQALPLQERQ